MEMLIFASSAFNQSNGKIALQMEPVQMKVVFRTFQKFTSQIRSHESLAYLDQLLMPFSQVCEGYSEKDIPEISKHLAQEISQSVRNTLGMENFVRVYSQLRKDLEDKGEKRKRDNKRMAIVDPVRNTKRTLGIACQNSCKQES